MKVTLVAVTEPRFKDPNTDNNLTADEFVAYVARVSNPSNQHNTLTAPKLLKYLVENKHWSPFELVDVVFEIETTRDIGRQILRHRSFSFQEFSQRYADPTSSLGFVTREARLQDKKNRQNSIETSDEGLHMEWENRQESLAQEALNLYNWALSAGIAKEQARAVLPEGLTLSRMYMKGSLRSWIHYCMVRMDPSTQKEHRDIASDIWSKIIIEFPSLANLDMKNEK